MKKILFILTMCGISAQIANPNIIKIADKENNFKNKMQCDTKHINNIVTSTNKNVTFGYSPFLYQFDKNHIPKILTYTKDNNVFPYLCNNLKMSNDGSVIIESYKNNENNFNNINLLLKNDNDDNYQIINIKDDIASQLFINPNTNVNNVNNNVFYISVNSGNVNTLSSSKHDNVFLQTPILCSNAPIKADNILFINDAVFLYNSQNSQIFSYNKKDNTATLIKDSDNKIINVSKYIIQDNTLYCFDLIQGQIYIIDPETMKINKLENTNIYVNDILKISDKIYFYDNSNSYNDSNLYYLDKNILTPIVYNNKNISINKICQLDENIFYAYNNNLSDSVYKIIGTTATIVKNDDNLALSVNSLSVSNNQVFASRIDTANEKNLLFIIQDTKYSEIKDTDGKTIDANYVIFGNNNTYAFNNNLSGSHSNLYILNSNNNNIVANQINNNIAAIKNNIFYNKLNYTIVLDNDFKLYYLVDDKLNPIMDSKKVQLEVTNLNSDLIIVVNDGMYINCIGTNYDSDNTWFFFQ